MLITRNPIDLNLFFSKIPPSSCGGSAFFVGRVRDHHEEKSVARLFYDCYEPMAEKMMGQILVNLKDRHRVESLRALHRIGWVEIGEAAVVIEASSAHRDAAFEACRAAIDEIKRNVPIWKKEVYADGTSAWPFCNAVKA